MENKDLDEINTLSSQVLDYYRNYSQNQNFPVYLRGEPPSVEDVIPTTVVTVNIDNEESRPPLIGCDNIKINVSTENDEQIRNPSPASSVTSNRKLEWDNLADIGYGNCQKQLHKSLSLPLLTKLEKIELRNRNIRLSPEGNRADSATQTILKHPTPESSDDSVKKTYLSSSSSSTYEKPKVFDTTSSSLSKPKTISSATDYTDIDCTQYNSNVLIFDKSIGLPMAESTPSGDSVNKRKSNGNSSNDKVQNSSESEKQKSHLIFDNKAVYAVKSSETVGEETSSEPKKSELKCVAKYATCNIKFLSITKPLSVECCNYKEISDKVIQTSFPVVTTSNSIAIQTDDVVNDDQIEEIEIKPIQTNRQVVEFITRPNSSGEASLRSIGVNTESDFVASQCNSFEYMYGPDMSEATKSGSGNSGRCSGTENNLGKLRRADVKIDLRTLTSDNEKTLSSNVTDISSKSSPLAELITTKLSNHMIPDVEKSISMLQKLIKSKKYDKVTKQYYVKKIVQKIVNCNYSSETSLNSEVPTQSSSDNQNLAAGDSPKRSKRIEKSKHLQENVPWVPPVVSNIEVLRKKQLDVKTFSTEILPQNFLGNQEHQPTKLKDSRFTLTNNLANYKKESENIISMGDSSRSQTSPQSLTITSTSSDKSKGFLNWKDEKTLSEKLLEEKLSKMSCGDGSSNDSELLLNFAKKERQNQLNWISNEINHLNKLKDLLGTKNKKRKLEVDVLTKPKIEDIRNSNKTTSVYVITTDKSESSNNCRLSTLGSKKGSTIPCHCKSSKQSRVPCTDSDCPVLNYQTGDVDYEEVLQRDFPISKLANLNNNVPYDDNIEDAKLIASEIYKDPSSKSCVRRYVFEMPITGPQDITPSSESRKSRLQNSIPQNAKLIGGEVRRGDKPNTYIRRYVFEIPVDAIEPPPEDKPQKCTCPKKTERCVCMSDKRTDKKAIQEIVPPLSMKQFPKSSKPSEHRQPDVTELVERIITTENLAQTGPSTVFTTKRTTTTSGRPIYTEEMVHATTGATAKMKRNMYTDNGDSYQPKTRTNMHTDDYSLSEASVESPSESFEYKGPTTHPIKSASRSPTITFEEGSVCKNTRSARSRSRSLEDRHRRRPVKSARSSTDKKHKSASPTLTSFQKPHKKQGATESKSPISSFEYVPHRNIPVEISRSPTRFEDKSHRRRQIKSGRSPTRPFENELHRNVPVKGSRSPTNSFEGESHKKQYVKSARSPTHSFEDQHRNIPIKSSRSPTRSFEAGSPRSVRSPTRSCESEVHKRVPVKTARSPTHGFEGGPQRRYIKSTKSPTRSFENERRRKAPAKTTRSPTRRGYPDKSARSPVPSFERGQCRKMLVTRSPTYKQRLVKSAGNPRESFDKEIQRKRPVKTTRSPTRTFKHGSERHLIKGAASPTEIFEDDTAVRQYKADSESSKPDPQTGLYPRIGSDGLQTSNESRTRKSKSPVRSVSSPVRHQHHRKTKSVRDSVAPYEQKLESPTDSPMQNVEQSKRERPRKLRSPTHSAMQNVEQSERERSRKLRSPTHSPIRYVEQSERDYERARTRKHVSPNQSYEEAERDYGRERTQKIISPIQSVAEPIPDFERHHSEKLGSRTSSIEEPVRDTRRISNIAGSTKTIDKSSDIDRIPRSVSKRHSPIDSLQEPTSSTSEKSQKDRIYKYDSPADMYGDILQKQNVRRSTDTGGSPQHSRSPIRILESPTRQYEQRVTKQPVSDEPSELESSEREITSDKDDFYDAEDYDDKEKIKVQSDPVSKAKGNKQSIRRRIHDDDVQNGQLSKGRQDQRSRKYPIDDNEKRSRATPVEKGKQDKRSTKSPVDDDDQISQEMSRKDKRSTKSVDDDDQTSQAMVLSKEKSRKDHKQEKPLDGDSKSKKKESSKHKRKKSWVESSSSNTETHSTDSSDSYDDTPRICICCHKNEGRFQSKLKGLPNKIREALCGPCYSGNQQIEMSSRPYYTSPGHVCNCYTMIKTETVRNIQRTVDELENLDREMDYCSCSYGYRSRSCKCGSRNHRKSIAYTLTFEDEDRSISDGDEKYRRSKPPPLDEIKVKVPRYFKKRHKDKENSKRHNHKDRSSNHHRKQMTLQDYLCANRPNFINTAEDRRKSMIELAYLREERCNKYKQLIALAGGDFSNDNLLKTQPKLHMYTSKQMREITKRNYKKLPEVQKKLADNKDKQIKIANKILADMFNRKLRNNVLKGNLTHSTNISVIKLP